jgi:hypothetical protein
LGIYIIIRGESFGDGDEYTIPQYLNHSHEQVKTWYAQHYADSHKAMTPLNIEKDYWNIIESLDQEYFVEYGNDVDTHTFGSGFPKSERGRCLGAEIDIDKVTKMNGMDITFVTSAKNDGEAKALLTEFGFPFKK